MAHSHHQASAFQMPSYTSHTSRGPGATGSPGRSKKHNFANGDFTTSASPGKHSRTSKPAHMDSDQSLLEMLSSTVACLKQKHMDLEALGCLEQSLWLKRRMFGVDNSVVQRALNEVVLSYNSVAMQYLAQAQFDQCLAMLRKAEAITAPGNFKKCQSLQILTFNNIGCCYRKLGKLKSALKYLKEAAQIGSTCAHVKNLSITHLNLCAIQSQLGRHDLALEHAQAAIFHTQEELVSMEARSYDSDRREEDCDDDSVGNGGDSGSASSDVLDAKSREEKIISLAVAYHNLAVELEFNGRGEASLQWYKKALQLVWKYRESNAALCGSFKKIFMDAKKKQEMQRTGGCGNGDSSGSSRSGAHTNSRLPQSVASRSSNAFSGDRRKPMAARPKSAHHTSSSRNGSSGGGFSGRAAAAAGDLSYSANVASQCYKPVKPSSAGLQYASPPKSTAANTRRGLGVQSKATLRQSSSASTASSGSGTRQRPMSASAARSSSSTRDSGGGGAADDLGPSIEAHWRKLEREFSIESANPTSATSANTSSNSMRNGGQHQSRAAAPAVKRPQSARPTTRSTMGKQQRPSLNQFDDGNGSLCGIEDDDNGCGVLDDDEPSENEEMGDEDLEDLDKSDEFEDLLLRRDDKQQQQTSQRGSPVRWESSQKPRTETEQQSVDAQQFAGRGHRHRQALEEARTKKPKTSAFASSERPATDASSQGSDSRPSVSCDGDESDLPNQRVSHMEYLRRMKRLAENIKDDLTGTSAPPVSVAPMASRSDSGSAPQPRKVPPRPAPVTTTNSATSQAMPSDADTIVTPRGSTSKVRERLESVRRDSFHTLPKYDGIEDDDQRGALAVKDNAAGNSIAKSSATARQEFVEIVDSTSNHCYTTELAVHVAEHELIRTAAAKRIQAFLRGERARAEAQKRRQQLREHEAALQIQLHAKQFAQHALEKRLEDEGELLVRAQQEEIENLAASTIQQLYKKKKFLISDDSHSFAQSTLNLPTEASTQVNNLPRRQSEPRAIGESPQQQQQRAPDSNRRRDSAAIVIQATMKGFVTREVVAEHRAVQLSRQYVERKHMEVALDHAMAKEQAFLEHLSAVKIQALVRGRQSRFLTEVTRIGLNAAAEKIQTSFRSHHKQLQKSTSVGVRSVAARSIQHLVRGYLHRQSRLHQAVISEERNEVHHIAAASLQKFWRQVVARREVLLEELEAATCIQALGRGHLARKSYQSLRDSASQVGLYKPSSAFSIPAIADDLPEYDEEFDVDGIIGEQHGSTRHAVNMGFLPSAVREMYLNFVDAPSYREACAEAQQSVREADKKEVEDMDLTFEDLMLELETCGDVAAACFAINAMGMLVLLDTEAHCTLTNAIKVAHVIDQRIQEHVIWTDDVQQASLWLLDAFHELLCAGV